MAYFSLDFTIDGDGDASLIASFDTGEFKGKCQYWCPPDEFSALTTALRTYPIDPEMPIDQHWCGGCIALRVEPVDSVGHLAVRVMLRDFRDDWRKCQAKFSASYLDIDHFREQLEAIIAKSCGKAVLSSV